MKADLNCDMGEGMENDAALIPYITSANIACGAHAGDSDTIKRTIEHCLRHNVHIGAHPGFADKAGFGRKKMLMEEKALFNLVLSQVILLKDIAEQMGGKLHHVKPHGAMYNMAAADSAYASVLIKAVQAADPTLIFYGLSGSEMIHEAQRLHIKTASEVFADRRYTASGKLLSRTDPRALITDPAAAAAQVNQMLESGTVLSTEGTPVPVLPETICVHGDQENALAILTLLTHIISSND